MNSGINIHGDDSAINLIGVRDKLQTLGADCEINLNGNQNEINLNGFESKINLNGNASSIVLNSASMSLNNGSIIRVIGGGIAVSQGSFCEITPGGILRVDHTNSPVFGFSMPSCPSLAPFINDCEDLGIHSLGNASGVVGVNPAGFSSRNIKRNIIDLDIGLEEVNKIRPVSYILKGDKSEKVNIGMIVEDLAEVDNRMVRMGPKLSFDGEEIIRDFDIEAPVPYKWEAREVIPVLVRAIQELSQKVKDLEEKVDA